MFKTSCTSCSSCLTSNGGHTLAFVKTQAVYECCAVASSAGEAKQQQHADSAADAVARYHALSELQPLPPPLLPMPAAATAAARDNHHPHHHISSRSPSLCGGPEPDFSGPV